TGSSVIGPDGGVVAVAVAVVVAVAVGVFVGVAVAVAVAVGVPEPPPVTTRCGGVTVSREFISVAAVCATARTKEYVPLPVIALVTSNSIHELPGTAPRSCSGVVLRAGRLFHVIVISSHEVLGEV